MYRTIFFFLLMHFVSGASAQNVGIGTGNPNPSAQLHIASSNKGLLIPQVAIDSLKDVTTITNPANGLIIYNTTQPGSLNDLRRGYYYYSAPFTSWVRLADNINDNFWKAGGLLGVQLSDKSDGVSMLDDFLGTETNLSPKIKILKQMDSITLNSKNNINSLVLTTINKKPSAGWEFRQKNSLLFENGYYSTNSSSSSSPVVAAIAGYTENPGTINGSDNRYNGLGFYTFSIPSDGVSLDTPALSMFYHNVGIGAYATDNRLLTDGRLQVTGFSNGDQLSLRHPNSTDLKWGLYVSFIDSSLNFYSNGSIRATIDRVTGVYSFVSDRNRKKNLKPLSPVLDLIKRVPLYTYEYLDSRVGDRRMIGLMAQDIQPFFPELVYQRYDRDINKPLLTVDYSGLGVIAMKAIQEQQLLIDNLQKEIMEIKASKQTEMINRQQLLIDQLLLRIEQLEKKLDSRN